MAIWIRRCSSFAEEARADREFWASMAPEDRVAAVESIRLDWLKQQGRPYEGLRRTVRVLEPSRR